MHQNYCFDKIYFILFSLIIFIVLIYQYYLINKYNNKYYEQQNNSQIDNIKNEIINVLSNRDIKIEEEKIPNIIVNNPIDPVRNYDYGKIFDPLVEPTRRIERDQIPPVYLRRLIDLPSRGFPDNFSQFGILVKANKNDPHNQILRLFGRQEFPGSHRYEYYTAIVSGLDQIKIPLDIKKNELYDGDSLYIRELGEKYIVQLHKYDAPKYLPDIW